MNTKLTPQLQHKILDLLKQGHFVESIARVLGFHKSTYYRWLEPLVHRARYYG